MGVDFKAYPEQLEFFFLASGVTDLKQKKAVLLTDLPTEMFQLAKDLMALMLREDSLLYDTIVECLQKQLLKPQKSALVSGYEYDNQASNAGETVSQYVAVLKRLAGDCKFNAAKHLERPRQCSTQTFFLIGPLGNQVCVFGCPCIFLLAYLVKIPHPLELKGGLK